MTDHGQDLIIQIFRKLRTENINQENGSVILVELRRYILSNLLSVIWSVSLFVGGLIFWVYYLSIGYFPDLDFDSSLLLLAVAALTGVGLIVYLSVGIMYPL